MSIRVVSKLIVVLLLMPGQGAMAADAEAVLAGYQTWLSGLGRTDLTATTETTFAGASPFRVVLTHRHAVTLHRDGDDWTIRGEREDVDLKTRRLKPKVTVEFKVNPTGSETVPRRPDGTVDENVIADPKARPEQIAKFLTPPVAFVFGHSDSNHTLVQVLKRGEPIHRTVVVAGRPVVELSSVSPWGRCSLTVDPGRGYAPLAYRQQVAAGDFVIEGKTLAEKPPTRSPFYPREPTAGTTTEFEVTGLSPGAPYRVAGLRAVYTTTYASGQSVINTSKATIVYPAAPATSAAVAQVPAGTPAVVHREDSGVEYVWNGQKAVPHHDPGFAARLKGVVFASPWRAWVAAAVAVLLLAGVALVWLRRARGRSAVAGLAVVAGLLAGGPAVAAPPGGGAYCGVRCVSAAGTALGHDVPLESLLRPRYLGSPRGSSLQELQLAAADHGLAAQPVVRLSVDGLRGLSGPAVLHVRGDGYKAGHTHWVLLLGFEGGEARLADPPNGVERIPVADLAARWDGVCLLLGRDRAGVVGSRLSAGLVSAAAVALG
jgi:hypothetical protein